MIDHDVWETYDGIPVHNGPVPLLNLPRAVFSSPVESPRILSLWRVLEWWIHTLRIYPQQWSPTQRIFWIYLERYFHPQEGRHLILPGWILSRVLELFPGRVYKITCKHGFLNNAVILQRSPHEHVVFWRVPEYGSQYWKYSWRIFSICKTLEVFVEDIFNR